MSNSARHTHIAIVGGDGRRARVHVEAPVRYYSSRRDGGRGAVQRLLNSLRAGGVRLVVLLVRWLGHSDFHAVVAAAKSAEVPIITVIGGASQARRAIVRELSEAPDVR